MFGCFFLERLLCRGATREHSDCHTVKPARAVLYLEMQELHFGYAPRTAWKLKQRELEVANSTCFFFLIPHKSPWFYKKNPKTFSFRTYNYQNWVGCKEASWLSYYLLLFAHCPSLWSHHNSQCLTQDLGWVCYSCHGSFLQQEAVMERVLWSALQSTFSLTIYFIYTPPFSLVGTQSG